MDPIRLIDIQEEILSEDRELADRIRRSLVEDQVFLLNVMGSPGCGKTSLVVRTIAALGERLRIAVVEADIDSFVDSETVAALGIRTVQIRTGGACHVDAPMMDQALRSLPLAELDLVVLENVGNLVCPAEFDTGATRNVAILSVPEGDDKPLKYPLMFTVSDVLVINKIDYLGTSDFDPERLKERVRALNPHIRFFELSCRTAAGIDPWIEWLAEEVSTRATRRVE